MKYWVQIFRTFLWLQWSTITNILILFKLLSVLYIELFFKGNPDFFLGYTGMILNSAISFNFINQSELEDTRNYLISTS